MVRANGTMRRHTKSQSRRSVGTRLRRRAMNIPHNIKELAGITRDAAHEQFESLRDDASKYFEQGRASMQHFEKSVARYIREQPVTSVLVAAGLGCLVGRFWMRR